MRNFGKDILKPIGVQLKVDANFMQTVSHTGFNEEGNEAYSYDEFGNNLYEHTSIQPFGFTGYCYDHIAGNLFAQARQYDPTTGRFISQDKIAGFVEAPLTLNAYTYCWNQPLNLVDLNGLWPWEWDWGEIWEEIRGIPSTIRRGVDLVIHSPFDATLPHEMFLAYWRGEQVRQHSYEHWLRNYGFSGRADLLDAWRHFTWMFDETRISGADRTRFIGDQNELVFLESLFHGSPRNYMLAMFDMDAIKDLWNNSVGIELGACSEHEGMGSDDLFWYLASPYVDLGSRTVTPSANPILILHEDHVQSILGIHPDSNGEVLGSWDLRSNSIVFTDNRGATTLCLYTREHTREPHSWRD